MNASRAPIFGHLLQMTDRRGTVEQARGSEPLADGGYRTEDMARVLVVAARQPDSDGEINGLARVAVQFLNDAQTSSGKVRNRMDRNGRWTDEPAAEDAWGRCMWALGIAAAHSDVSLIRRLAVIQFERSAKVRSASSRAMAFAVVGAAEVLSVEPTHSAARALITDFAAGLVGPDGNPSWSWPEPRLTQTNAVLPEAMIAAGAALEDAELQQRGLDLLAWLIDHETTDGHLSPTPVSGSGPDDTRPAFDQRPIEVAALADACARAAAVDGSSMWADSVRLAAGWFDGDNDAGLPMWDALTGGGFDRLQADGVDRDQGAGATLAVLSTLQHALRLSPVPN